MKMTPILDQYTPMQVLAQACAVVRELGFVKRNDGYYDHATETTVFDTRTVVLNSLRVNCASTSDAQMASLNPDIPCISVTDEDREHAQEVFGTFDQRTILAKMSGEMNDYDCRLLAIFDKKSVNLQADISVLSSLPHSYVIQGRRDKMELFFATNRLKGSFIGQTKQRLKISADVQDVKFIPKQNIYLVTALTDQDQIAKFFLKGEDGDLSDRIRDNRITFVGTVKKQEVSDYTGCHETMFNRVKIE